MGSNQKEAEKVASFMHFIEHGNARRTSKHLRNILLDYIDSQKNCLPIDFELYLTDIRLLFDFLDAIQE